MSALLPSEKGCALDDVRVGGKWWVGDCAHLDLSVGGTRSSPWSARPGLAVRDATDLASALRNATALRTLTVPGVSGIFRVDSQPTITARGMAEIAFALPATLEELHVHGHLVGDVGAVAIGRALVQRSCGRLRTLSLEWNDIRDRGAKALAAALNACPIERLNLEHNWVSRAGAEHLASALATNTALRTLQLGGNNVGVGGARAFARALRSNRALRRLDLYNNHLGTAGAASLLPAVSKSALAELSLAYNYIDADFGRLGGLALVAQLRAGAFRALRVLDIRWNHFHQCHCGMPERLRRAAGRWPNLELRLEQEDSS